MQWLDGWCTGIWVYRGLGPRPSCINVLCSHAKQFTLSLCFLHSGPVCSMLGKDNPGFVWNFISDLKALKENSVWFFLSIIWLLDALKRIEKIIWNRLMNREIKKTRFKLKLGWCYWAFKQLHRIIDGYQKIVREA